MKGISSAGILVAGIVAQLALTLTFVFTFEPSSPGFAENMTIDGQAYLKAAREMAERDSWLFPPRTYHSPGHQLLVNAVTRISELSPIPLKLFNVFCFAFTLVLTFAIGRKLGMSRDRSLLVVFLLSSSLLVQRYCATMQYEVVAMAILACATYFAVSNNVLGFGLSFVGLCLFRLHLALPALPLIAIFMSIHGRQAALKSVAVVASFVLVAWAAYALRFETLRGFQGWPSFSDTRWLCLGARGSNFPYFTATPESVCGLEFLTSHPAEYLALLGRRVAYWVGWKKDIWSILGYPPTVEKLLVLLNVVAIGAALFMNAGGRKIRIFAICVLVSGLPFLVAGASTRFLVPVMPFIMFTLVGVCASALAMAPVRRWETT